MKYIVLLAAACLGLTACSTDIEQPRLAAHEGENYPAPTLADFADVFVNADNSGENVSFVCSPVDFGVSVPVSYRLYLEAEGYDAIHVASSYVPTITLTKADLNGRALNSFGATDNEPSALSAYVIAYAGESEIHTEPSNIVTFNITTYKAPLKLYYLCGIFNGWEAGTAPNMYETGAGTNVYSGVFHLTEDTEHESNKGYSPFKVLPVRAWNGDMGYGAFKSRSASITEAASDGNLQVTPGIWQITVTIASENAIDAKEFTSFYVTGDWCSWGGSDVATALEYDVTANVWKSEKPIPAGEAFKIVYETSAGQTWLGGDGAAENMPEGRTDAVKLTDNNVPNFTAPAGDKYVVVYADRTPFVMDYDE